MEFDKIIAEKCKEIRVKNKISIKEMSTQLGVKTEIIKRYETGATRMPFNVLMFYAELKRNNGNYKSKKK